MKFAFISQEKVAFPSLCSCRLPGRFSERLLRHLQRVPSILLARHDDKLAEQVRWKAHASKQGPVRQPARLTPSSRPPASRWAASA